MALFMVMIFLAVETGSELVLNLVLNLMMVVVLILAVPLVMTLFTLSGKALMNDVWIPFPGWR